MAVTLRDKTVRDERVLKKDVKKGRLMWGRSDVIGETGSDWETENIIYDAIKCGKH